jgi:hypothetical protein
MASSARRPAPAAASPARRPRNTLTDAADTVSKSSPALAKP